MRTSLRNHGAECTRYVFGIRYVVFDSLLTLILSFIALVAGGRAKDLTGSGRHEGVLCGGGDGKAREEDANDFGDATGSGLSQKVSGVDWT